MIIFIDRDYTTTAEEQKKAIKKEYQKQGKTVLLIRSIADGVNGGIYIMEFKIVKALKVRSDLYIEAGKTVCFSLADGTEWDGKLIYFDTVKITVLIDGTEKQIKYKHITNMWK